MDYIQSERAWGWTSYRCKYQTCDSLQSTFILLWKGAGAAAGGKGGTWRSPFTLCYTSHVTNKCSRMWTLGLSHRLVECHTTSNAGKPALIYWNIAKAACKLSCANHIENHSCQAVGSTWETLKEWPKFKIWSLATSKLLHPSLSWFFRPFSLSLNNK